MGWGWYLQNDIQLFILSMALLLVYSIKPIICKGLIGLLTVLSLIFTFVWTYQNGTFTITHLADFGKWGNFFADVYVKPWARCPPYIFGLFCGILYQEYLVESKFAAKHQEGEDFERVELYSKLERIFKNNKFARLGCEWAGIILMFFLVAIPRTLQVGQ